MYGFLLISVYMFRRNLTLGVINSFRASHVHKGVVGSTPFTLLGIHMCDLQSIVLLDLHPSQAILEAFPKPPS